MMGLTGLDVRLRSISSALERALAGIEPIFLQAGGHLSDSVEHMGRLTQGFGTMAGRLEDADTVAAMAVLRDLSARIAGLGSSTQASEARLEAMHGRAAALGSRIARLRKTIGEVKVLAINAKVEAAHVTARNVDFTVFTREIDRLASLAGEGLGQLETELAGLLDTMQGARGGLAAFARDHRQSLASVGARLGHGLAAMEGRSRDSAQAMRGLADLSRHMAGQVAQAVEGLQVGDITRQRGEHVVEALATLREVLASSGMPDGHRDILAASVCRLQSAQAGEAAEDLRRETARIKGNLAGLSADVADLPRRCASAYGATADSQTSFLSELGQELQEAHHLLRRYAQARASVDKVVADVSTVVAGMVRHIEAIHSIEADMRVMGLNATFKCARLGGEGLALSVIAQELRTYSNRTAEDGAAIMADLRRLIEAARQLDERERQGQATGDMESGMASAVATLDRVGDELTRALAGLSAGCGAATQALGRAQRLLESHPEFAAALSEASGVLVECGGDAVAEGGVLDDIRDEVLDLVRGRYTMASERKVHEMLSGAMPEAAAAPAAADDFLF